MKNNVIYIFIVFIYIVSCNTNNSTPQLEDRFIMPSIPGDYEPKGLRKVSIMEMKKIGETTGIPPGIVFKDVKGNTVSSDYYSSGHEPKYVQFYANSTGQVEEGVVHEMTPELKAMMMLMRLATMPVRE
ncbi:MAG: hypothetical protein HOP11_13545 [Saprospiraceae bacterium]|nr:hypothetical protein [Saprospiraceae bacterium]